MKSEKALLVLASVLSVACPAIGWGVSPVSPRIGRCPQPNGMANFSTYEFGGTWKVRYMFQMNKYSECTTLDFTPTSETTMDLNILDRVSCRLNVETDGKSIAPVPSEPASMLWSWNYFPSSMEKVVVMDTDYDHYAVLFMCQDYFLLHQPTVIILSKYDELPSIYISRAQNLVQSFHPVGIYWKPVNCYRDTYCPTNETETKSFSVDKSLSAIVNVFKPLTE